MQEQEKTLDSSAYDGVGLSRSPLPKPSPYLAQRSSVPQQLSPSMVSQTPVTRQSIMQWGKTLIDRSKAKKSETVLKLLWDENKTIWGQICKESMLAYINLLIGIDMYGESEPEKFLSDVRALIQVKRFEAISSKAEFQI